MDSTGTIIYVADMLGGIRIVNLTGGSLAQR